MPAVRLKAKLVIAITGMVLAIVAILSAVYLDEFIRSRVDDVGDQGDKAAEEIFAVARGVVQNAFSASQVDLTDKTQIEQKIDSTLKTDGGVNSLMDSVITYLPEVQDAAITGRDGRAIVHTSPSFVDTVLQPREDFASLAKGSIWKQLKVIYGPIRVFDVRVPLLLNGALFCEVRVGVSTVFIKDQLRGAVRHAVISSGLAILIALLLAAGLSNFALRPLEAISRRLDLISSGQVETVEPPTKRKDEYGAVSTKIERLGRQMRDVKEIFSALKENLDQMMANLQDGVMLFTSNFNAVLVSASAERFIGKSRGDMLGGQPSDIFSQDSLLGRTILQAFATHRSIGVEEIELENGRRIQIALDFIQEHGERIGALLTLRDAESVHRIEDEIELSRRLAAIGRLTSGVAHEVKNPINAIVVHLEVLRQKLPQIEPDTRRHMDVIETEIKRLDRVVQTLVDFTRPVNLRLADMDLRKLVDEVSVLASPEAERRNVRVERNMSLESLPVRVDADLVKQALLNIVINGIQAMPAEDGGALHIGSARQGSDAVITVRDEGPGIPADIRDKIYNLYFTTKKGGSGIGLPMAYRVLQLHNGSLEFDSVEGKGATFTLRIPLAELDGPEPFPETSADPVKIQ